ncbi:MAG: TIGR01459 family HAD-type hydrolase [Runella sp.]
MFSIESFADIAPRYQVFFFDAFGVLKNYQGLIAGIAETFAYLRHTQKPFYILTNDASRSPHQLAETYWRLGLEEIRPENIVSSGMLAREYLQLKVSGGTVAYLGTEDSAHYIQSAGLNTLPISALDLNSTTDISALVLLDDEGFDWNQDLSKTVNLLRRRNLPVIVANTDTTYPISKNQVALAIGSVADMLENVVGKQFIRFGKPDAQMFMFAYERMLESYPDFSKKDILMIGDTLRTDIAGGNKFGLDTALVLTGNIAADDAEVRIRSTGIIPTYICESAGMFES